jgi:hypothetical protein
MMPIKQISDHVLALLPILAVMSLIGIAGILIAVLTRRIVVGVLRMVRFNDFAYNAGFTAVLQKANVHQTPALVVANIAYGIALITVWLLGLSLVNLSVTSTIVMTFFRWIPNVLVAAVILIAGYLLSKFIARSVLLTAVNAEVRSARVIAFAVQTLIMVFTVAVSLEQIGIAENTIIAAFSILFGGLVLALAIAFGLGGRDIAKDFLERQVKHSSDTYSERHPFSHL